VFVLLGFFADPKFRVRQVVVGQYIGIGALYGASVVASLISLVIPPAYIRLLGLAPIVIGLKKAWELRKGADANEAELEDHEKASAGRGSIVAIAACHAPTMLHHRPDGLPHGPAQCRPAARLWLSAAKLKRR
jgi:cadmium resistance protein CadD (predicted permease)